MPHLKLEYSTNIPDTPNPKELFSDLHILLAEYESFQASGMKSRIIPCSSSYVADGAEDKAFIHLELAILPGRSPEEKASISKAFHTALKSAFPKTASEKVCSFTVEIREIAGESYSKEIVEGA